LIHTFSAFGFIMMPKDRESFDKPYGSMIKNNHSFCFFEWLMLLLHIAFDGEFKILI